MSLYSIATEYNGPLEAAHAHGDDDRCDLAECGAAGQLKLDLSEQLRGCCHGTEGTGIVWYLCIDLFRYSNKTRGRYVVNRQKNINIRQRQQP